MISRKRSQVEDEQNWAGEMEHIPFIKFPADWEVQMIPPFNDAVVRFRVRLPNGLIKSIYLDSRMSLGYCKNPYWEVYPYRGDCGRCDRANVDLLLEMIADLEEGEKYE